MADASGLLKAVETRAGFIARRLALDLDQDLHRAAAPHNATGEMMRAIRVRQGRTGPTTWRVEAEVPVLQAATTDRGARPHVIVPRHKTVLRFVAGGRVVFARVVHHPGNPPSKWFSNVMSAQNVRAVLGRFVGR